MTTQAAKAFGIAAGVVTLLFIMLNLPPAPANLIMRACTGLTLLFLPVLAGALVAVGAGSTLEAIAPVRLPRRRLRSLQTNLGRVLAMKKKKEPLRLHGFFHKYDNTLSYLFFVLLHINPFIQPKLLDGDVDHKGDNNKINDCGGKFSPVDG